MAAVVMILASSMTPSLTVVLMMLVVLSPDCISKVTSPVGVTLIMVLPSPSKVSN